jgi:hypothetical protein
MKAPELFVPDLHLDTQLFYEEGLSRVDIVRLTGGVRLLKDTLGVEIEAVVPGVPRYARVVWIRPEQLKIYR